MLSLPVVEIFASRQGEGAQTGRPAVFVRLGGCNLACPWCDTDFRHAERVAIDVLLQQVDACSEGIRSVIVTGGEPTIHPELPALLEALKGQGYWIGIETNGVNAPQDEVRRFLDYLAVSPKALYEPLYDEERMVTEADEVRIVVDGEIDAFCAAMRERIHARHYFLSPCEREGKMNWEETVETLGRINRNHRHHPWLLSVQSHKLAGFR